MLYYIEALDYPRIAARAVLVRHKAGCLDADPPYRTRQIMAVFPRILVTGMKLPDGVVELARKVGTQRTIFYNREAPGEERRVGIIHGLGHHLTDLKRAGDARQCELMSYRPRIAMAGLLSARNPVERACDLFAAEVLVPFEQLDRRITGPMFPTDTAARHAFEDEIDALASLFEVPSWLIRARLKDLSHLRRTSLFLR